MITSQELWKLLDQTDVERVKLRDPATGEVLLDMTRDEFVRVTEVLEVLEGKRDATDRD